MLDRNASLERVHNILTAALAPIGAERVEASSAEDHYGQPAIRVDVMFSDKAPKFDAGVFLDGIALAMRALHELGDDRHLEVRPHHRHGWVRVGGPSPRSRRKRNAA